MIVEYLLAVFLIGLEAERPPTIVSPHSTIESCNRAKVDAEKEIEQVCAKTQAYPACLKVLRGGTPV
jgi:hypothetical protein